MGLLVLGAGSAFAGVTAFTNVQALLPSPLLHVHTEVQGDHIDRNPPRDPRIEIQITNMGLGPMHVREFH